MGVIIAVFVMSASASRGASNLENVLLAKANSRLGASDTTKMVAIRTRTTGGAELRLAQMDTADVKKKLSTNPDWIDDPWVLQAYEKLLNARKTWERLREDAPNLYDYEAKFNEIDKKISQLREVQESEDEEETEDTTAREPSSTPILVPGKLEESDTEPESDSGYDGPGSDVFFQDEGIVDADLPAESELTVSGRQFIEANLSTTEYPNDPQRETQSNVSVDQQLKVRIRGSIADDLLEIEIDYDDSLPDVEQQQTRVLYNGRERDLGFSTFQAQGKFGDVELSLPNTTFVSYNKSVFGLSGQLQFTDFQLGGWGPKDVTFYGIASEKKGETQKEEFTGNNQRRVPDPIPDISPIRRTYYQPLADRTGCADPQQSCPELPIQVDSVRILVDDRNAENNDDNTLEDYEVSNGSETYEGDFDEWTAGEDYSIDYRTGVIRFRRSIQKNMVIAVSFTQNDGTRRSDFLIKDRNESDKYDPYHLENRYQLASRNIVRNDPDRVLEIRDPTGSTGDTNQSYAETLEVDQNGDGVIDDQFINFELGVLRFPDTQPFVRDALSDTNSTIYGPPAQRNQFYEIYQEVLVEENTYTLGVNVVRNSEEVIVDGQTLERGEDYTIDYQTGFLSFFDHVEIDDETTIEINYEEQGSGAQRSETFLGGRVETTISENLSMGSTLLTSQEQERDEIPQVGRSTKSTSVNELAVKWNPVRSLQNMLSWWGDPTWQDYPWKNRVDVDLKFDWAESTRNPSQEGQALVDDFSQLDRRIPFSKSEYDWSPADPIQQFPGQPENVLPARSPVRFDEVENEGHDPNPEEDENQESMRVRMPMGTGSNPDTWASFQQLFSNTGQDLRGYDFLEFWVKWENQETAGGTLTVDLGNVTENTDRRPPPFLTEDENGNQILNSGEDDGYVTHDFRFGANNGQLDSEDLDGNGRMDEEEGYLHFRGVNHDTTVVSDTTGEGWTVYKIPLRAGSGDLRGDADRRGKNPSDTPTRDEVLQNASMVRFTYESPDESGEDRSFLLEQMGAVQSRWTKPNDFEDFQLGVKTSAEDHRLPAPGTNSFRESNETAKGLSYIFENGINTSDSQSTRATLELAAGEEVRNFRQMELLFNTKKYTGSSDTAFIRFGSDDSNFFQYNFHLASDPSSDPRIEALPGGGQWYRLTLDLETFEQDLIDKTLGDTDVLRRGRRLVSGDPSLRDVKQYTLGVEADASGELLFGALSLTEPREESGEAVQSQATVDLMDGFLQFDATQRDVEGEFRTIGLVNSSVANQFVAQNEESRSVQGSMDVNRMIPDHWSIGIPLNFQWSDETTEIPPDRIERVRTEDVGRVQTREESINTGLNTPGVYPSFTFNWSDLDKEVNQEQRDREFVDRESNWRLGGSYGVTFDDPIGGYLPVGERLKVQTDGRYGRFEEVRRSFGEVDVDTRSRNERSRGLTTSVQSDPWSWLQTTTSFNFSDLHRETRQYSGLITRDQSVDFSMTPSGFWGLNPSYDFTTGISETFNRGGDVTRSVNLDGSSNLRIRTNPTRWWQRLDFLSLTYRYRINSSARYNELGSAVGNSDVYRNFFTGPSWLVRGPDLEVTSDTLTLSRNRASKDITHSFGGQLRIWQPLDSRYNLDFSQNFGQSENSVNQTDATSFSLNNRLQLRRVSETMRRWTESANLNLNYNLNRSESNTSEERTHRPTVQLNTRWNRRWSTNFSLSATLTTEEDQNVLWERTGWNPALDFKWLVNDKNEEGTLWFDNRLEISGSLSAQVNEEIRNGEIRGDDRELSGDLGGTYNLTEKIRMRFSGNFSRFRDNFREANDRNQYGVRTSVDFRF